MCTRATILTSAFAGFGSFFLFLGFGYFDPFHAFVTAILFSFLLLALQRKARSTVSWRETSAAGGERTNERRPRPRRPRALSRQGHQDKK